MNNKQSRPLDFWRVNSYGYPNPLIDDHKSQEAWKTLLSFFDHESYSKLKSYWASPAAPRRLTRHAVESWKATFEEFGLLYVLRGSDSIQITPAGRQFRAAADAENESLLAWIGLSLLLRYPLRGPRQPKSDTHADSNLLVYRFLYAAMYDLRKYFWWTELERILCRVFQTEQADQAIKDVQALRASPSDIDRFSLPASQRQGAFYNSLNQVIVHASMNHMLLHREVESSHYRDTEPKRRHLIARQWLPLIQKGLNLRESDDDCGSSASAVSRLPMAPEFENEESYFEYLGAPVPDSSDDNAGRAFPTVSIGGDLVALLKEGQHYERQPEGAITGKVRLLCALSIGQRIILSSDQGWTYFVESKQLVKADELVVRVRKGRPITDSRLLAEYWDDPDD